MIKNYLRIAWMRFRKERSYGLINLLGLSIGIASAMLILLWVEDEINFDNTYTKKELLYAVRENQTYDGKVRTFDNTPGPFAAAVKAEIPGVVNSCRTAFRRGILFSAGEKAIYERGCYTDSSFFSMFTISFLEGSAKDAFKQLNGVVISDAMAKRFFGEEKNVVGKTLKVDNSRDVVVTGVIKEPVENSTLQFEWLAPFEVFSAVSPWVNDWGNNSIDTYVELAPTASPVAIDKQLAGFIGKKSGSTGTQAFLFAMKDWHLRDEFTDGKQTGGQEEYVQLFAIVAGIILLIACINFMNLATARSEKRAKEVGVRKVLGAGRKRLAFQFIGEALLLSALAVVAGVLLLVLVLPAFNALVGKQLQVGWSNPIHFATLAGIALLCGLVAGSYPAFYLSSFNPVTVFKSQQSKTGSAVWIRKGLVVVQFSISIILIVSTVVVYQQVQYVKNRNIGYNKENLLDIDVRGDMLNNFGAIKQELLNSRLIENVALSSYETINIGNNSTNHNWQGKDPSKSVLISNRMVSPEFISTLGMHIVKGRDFRVDTPADSSTILITESLERIMGKDSAVGKTIAFKGNNYQVVGIVQDFIYGDMYNKSDPVVFFYAPAATKYFYVRMKTGANPEEALAQIQSVWKKYNPAYPFVYRFVNDAFNRRFKSEMLIEKLSQVFAALAIIISCLGLFGLAAYTAERRTKEIGVRKVLGASVNSLAGLLSAEFLQLVIFSCILAFPVAWWVMSRWLQGYNYHTSIRWHVFVAAGICALIIAVFTVSFQAIKTAMASPIKSLRTE